MAKIQIAPSLLSANFSKLGEEIYRVVQAGADVLHLDVMDGHFVPNITFGPCVVKGIREASSIPLDVHLMISDPEKYLEDFVNAGSDWITFHVETVKNPEALIEKIHAMGKKAGISFKPATPVEKIQPYLGHLDLVLVMSVEPGFGGQKFLPESLDKVKKLRSCSQCPEDISIDGGINLETAAMSVQAGVNILVAGSTIFKASDPGVMVQKLRSVIQL